MSCKVMTKRAAANLRARAGIFLPCPFCGGKKTMELEAAGYNGLGFVRCRRCFASGPERKGGTFALAAWNLRKSASPASARGEGEK